MAEAETVVDDLDSKVTRADLVAQTEQQTQWLASLWRRDLLLVITGQFVALAGVLTAIS
jgi:hypothetical protein